MSNLVKTFDGTEALREKCRYIKGEFYEVNRQCFLMPDGRYHRIGNGFIEFDHETGTYVLKSNVDLINGIVGFEGEHPILGKYTSNEVKNINVYIRNKESGAIYNLNCIDPSILPEKQFQEALGWQAYMDKSVKSEGINNKHIYKRYDANIKIHYIFEHMYPKFKQWYEKYFTYNSIPNNFYKELGDTTFGVENETINGVILVNHIKRTGLIPVLDGSLRQKGYEPYEYVSLPLQGEKGLRTIEEHCNLLNKYCEVNKDCALHVHIGNIEITDSYVVGLFKTLKGIEDELYSLFPKDFVKTSKFKKSGKDYCKKLPSIDLTGDVDQDIISLFEYYSGSGNYIDPIDPEYFKLGMNHPADKTNGDRKWNVDRYYHTNLIPTMFGSRKTVEFRVHIITRNKDKIINWIFIANAICRFAKLSSIENLNLESKLSLEYILQTIYSEELSNYLLAYIQWRKDYMMKLTDNKDYYGQHEIENDSLDGFEYKFKSLLDEV